jgi:hypothetical protein
MRRLTTPALALLAAGCMNFPSGLDGSGGGGGGGGGDWEPAGKQLRFEIEVVSAESLSPVVGASVRVWSWDGSDHTTARDKVSGTVRPSGLARGQTYINCSLEDHPLVVQS